MPELMIQQATIETPRPPPARALLVGRGGYSALNRYLIMGEQLELNNDLTVEVNPLTSVTEHAKGKVDLVVGLDGTSTAFEFLLTPHGIFLLNESGNHPPPERRDIETVIVPVSELVGGILDASENPTAKRFEKEIEECVMLGVALALQHSPPLFCETGILQNQEDSLDRTVLQWALCRGYDWVQERTLRGKSLDSEA